MEADLHELLSGPANRGGLRVHPHAILGSTASFLVRFGIPTFFASSREVAEFWLTTCCGTSSGSGSRTGERLRAEAGDSRRRFRS